MTDHVIIRKSTQADFTSILEVIIAASAAYRSVIPADRWKEPYMPEEELRQEITDGVQFWCAEINQNITGVMGIQSKKDTVALIRHAYVRPEWQGRGIGSALLDHLTRQTSLPLLVGTWADAGWAIRFYQKHGFQLVASHEKDRLLQLYWDVPKRQRETSVVLADQQWFDRQAKV